MEVKEECAVKKLKEQMKKKNALFHQSKMTTDTHETSEKEVNFENSVYFRYKETNIEKQTRGLTLDSMISP